MVAWYPRLSHFWSRSSRSASGSWWFRCVAGFAWVGRRLIPTASKPSSRAACLMATV